MARLARVVVAGVAHHVTQRGNRRQPTFFQEDDYRAYLQLLAEWCGRGGVEVWAYCLMPNRYVELNPVPARLCRVPWRWRWSSAALHTEEKAESELLNLQWWYEQFIYLGSARHGTP